MSWGAGLLLLGGPWGVTSAPQASVSSSLKWSNGETQSNARREGPRPALLSPLSGRPALSMRRHLASEYPAGASYSFTNLTHTWTATHPHVCAVTEGAPSTVPTPRPACQLSGLWFGRFVLFWGACVWGCPPSRCVPSPKASSCLHKTHSKWPAAHVWVGSIPWDPGSGQAPSCPRMDF